ALQDAVLLGQCRGADQHEQRGHDGYGSQTSDHAASSRAARAASTAPTFTFGLVKTTSAPSRSGNRNSAPEGRSSENILRVPSRPSSLEVASARPGRADSSTPSPLPTTTSWPRTATTWRTVSSDPNARSARSTSASSRAGSGGATRGAASVGRASPWRSPAAGSAGGAASAPRGGAEGPAAAPSAGAGEAAAASGPPGAGAGASPAAAARPPASSRAGARRPSGHQRRRGPSSRGARRAATRFSPGPAAPGGSTPSSSERIGPSRRRRMAERLTSSGVRRVVLS